ncbi:MAG: hypothetical protein A2W21_08045 [Betaproteobacteria bacterium RBG_16_66_20]|nr:MAG: hypothetical protein A2W21_08045 [Betaproteobacteria bacterium RBG_16_66_20]
MNIRWHAFYLSLIGILLVALVWQGAKPQRVTLGLEREVAPTALYGAIRKAPGKHQIVDLRPAAEFEDGHLPQAVRIAIPLAPGAPLDRYRPTIVVTDTGDPGLFAALAGEFKLAANLEGGMMQWRMSRLPEVSGLTDIEGMRRGRAG